MNLLRCDQCGRVTEEPDSQGWVAVLIDDDTLDLCSWGCVRDRAVEVIRDRNGP